MVRFRQVIPIVWAFALGCGVLQTPDLQHGAVTGRIPGAQTGAYAYVLGSPDLLAPAAADGSFRLDLVPKGTSSIVLFDGSAGAESVPVQVDGASISHIDPGRPLKAAAMIVVSASPLSGTLPTGLAFTVLGTPLRAVSAESGSARLFPLPAGTFGVTAAQPGFQDQRHDIALAEGGTDSWEVNLDVAEHDDRRGCLSCGCEHGLACSPDDGRCYLCVTDADCGTGGTCTASHACSYPAGTGLLCEACTSTSDCSGSGAACVNAAGAVLTGYCSTACSGTESCPSGFDCSGGACTAPSTCLAISTAYGGTCTEDTNCQAALKDGKCFPFNRPSGTAGYCSGKVQAGCPAGFTPDPQGSGYCAR